MLDGLDDVPWADLEHAYGTAEDVPGLLRQLLVDDPKVRERVMFTLYGNVFHQGSRYPAAPHVIPFLIEMCADPTVPGRGDLLRYWGSLITGYFSVQERPCWGDGERIHCEEGEDEEGEVEADPEDAYAQTLHAIYRESLLGFDLLIDLLDDEEPAARLGAAWVLACLPTRADDSAPRLESRLADEPSGWVRAAIAFAVGELGRADPLRRMLADDSSPAARCMAACELARIAPDEALIDPLLGFVAEPIEDYGRIPGAGGKSTGDAAFSISNLPAEVRRLAVPAICDQLDRARSFDTMPLVTALLSAGFAERREPLTGPELDPLQREILIRMVNTEELWSVGNLYWTFGAYGLPHERERCAELVGVLVADDEALTELRKGLLLAQMGFLEKGRGHILRALEIDPAAFERAPSPDESWLLCAKAFAETEPERALAAFRNACSINPAMAHRVQPGWHLASLLERREPG